MNTERHGVNIYDYLDFREYLKDYYAHMKELDPSFSYAKWAEKGLIKSRSFLRLIVVGKRSLTENNLPSVLQTLELSRPEANYFITLVRFNQARDIEAREKYLSELKSYANQKMTKIYDTYNYLSSHWCPRVHVLLTLEDIDKSLESLAKMTKLSNSKMEQVLAILEKAGIASQNDKGQWYAKDTVFHIPDELNNLAIQSFHKNSLEIATEAISTNPEERQYQSIFMALSESEYQEMASEIDKVTTNLLKKFSSSKGKNKKLYQLNTNLIPVSSLLIHSSDIINADQNVSEKHDHNHSQEFTNESI